MFPQATTDFYRGQQHLSVVTIKAIRRAWVPMGDGPWNEAWSKVGPRILVLLSAAQVSSARRADDYVGNVLAQTDQPDDPAGSVNPRAFAGVASDGLPLDSLLYGGVVTAGRAYSDGNATGTQALESGLAWIEGVAATQIADVGRSVVGIGVTARVSLHGYTRFLSPPSCQRCAILAGRVYRWSTGFQRHPRCDCQMFPAQSEEWAKSEGFVGNPDDAWRQGHIKDLSKAQQMALEDGADISQVVNAQAGMSRGQVFGQDIKYTTSGTTKRGAFGRSQTSFTSTNKGRRGYVKNYRERRATDPRLMPESIYKLADDREHAVRLLKKYGYIL